MNAATRDVSGQTSPPLECSICLEHVDKPLYMNQCTHGFHPVCVMRALDTYLKQHGTHWQTVPCPLCRCRISYHIIMNNFIRTCTLEEAKAVIHADNLYTRCHPDWSLLHVAAMAGNIPVARYLIERGLPADEVNALNHTPVYIAAFHGQTEMVRFLVEEHRANVHVKNLFEQTLFEATRARNHRDTVAYLTSIMTPGKKN
jgi:hypothetical protein